MWYDCTTDAGLGSSAIGSTFLSAQGLPDGLFDLNRPKLWRSWFREPSFLILQRSLVASAGQLSNKGTDFCRRSVHIRDMEAHTAYPCPRKRLYLQRSREQLCLGGFSGTARGMCPRARKSWRCMSLAVIADAPALFVFMLRLAALSLSVH